MSALTAVGDSLDTSVFGNMNGSYSQQSLNKSDLKQIVRLQSLIRGYLSRRNYIVKNAQKVNQMANCKYFTRDEFVETFSNRKNKEDYQIAEKYDPQRKREKKDQYKYKTGSLYDGEWFGNFRDGFGTMIWPDGAQYIGNWSFNRACGKGQFIHAEGDVYDGEWHMDRACGYGVYQHFNGALYQGFWKDDLQHGHGYEKWVDGSSYLGGYCEGQKEGLGLYKWSDGSDYEGEWHQNKINGVGVYTWLDGRRFEGSWKNNNMEGIGCYQWSDGRRYEGEYKEDKKHGFGIYQWADGRVYLGYWCKGKQHGLGTYKTQESQNLRYGLWEDGKRTAWFDEEVTVTAICCRQYDYTQLFTLAHSTENLISSYDSRTHQRSIVSDFNPPKKFEEQLKKVKGKIEETKIAARLLKEKKL